MNQMTENLLLPMLYFVVSPFRQGFRLVNLLKRNCETCACFPVNLLKYLRHLCWRTSANYCFCISNTRLGQTTLQSPSPNIAKQQEKETQCEGESFKSKVTLH